MTSFWDALQRVYEAKTLEEIHMALEEAGRNLQQLQVFRKLHMLVHEAPLVCVTFENYETYILLLLPILNQTPSLLHLHACMKIDLIPLLS